MATLRYLGHSAFTFGGGGGRVVIDPFLSGNPNAPMRVDELDVEAVLLTHGHGDHLGDAIAVAMANRATIIAPFELANYCAAQGATVHPMHIGGAHQFDFGRVKLTIAHHGSSAPDGTYTGPPCGFVVSVDNATLYHPGDTGLFLDMKLIGEMDRIDVAVLPIGDNFTMGIDDAVKAAQLLNPALAIPMHYDTFEVIAADPQEFVDKVQARDIGARVLAYGEAIEI